MAGKDMYGVQTFVDDQKGGLAQGKFLSCADADEARRTAEARVESARAAGAAAFCRMGVGEFDEGEAVTIAIYGRVPDGVTDALPF